MASTTTNSLLFLCPDCFAEITATPQVDERGLPFLRVTHHSRGGVPAAWCPSITFRDDVLAGDVLVLAKTEHSAVRVVAVH